MALSLTLPSSNLKLPIISARETTEENTRVGARLEGHACSSKSYAKSEFRPRFYHRQTTRSLIKDYVKNSAQIYSTTFLFFFQNQVDPEFQAMIEKLCNDGVVFSVTSIRCRNVG